MEEIEKHINANGRDVLLISDLHVPYHHKDSVKFLAAVKNKLLSKRSLILNVGDEADGHGLSFHDSIMDLDSSGIELEKTRLYFSEIEALFPTMYICESNHGSLIYRRSRSSGIPLEFIKPLSEVYGVKKWSWHDSIVLETKKGKVYVAHGKTASVGKLALSMGMSAVQGHYHGKFCLNYLRTPAGLRFDMYVGCLIDYKSLAFHYGKNHLPKPILGVGYIDKDGDPHLIPMEVDKKGNWNEKIKIL